MASSNLEPYSIGDAGSVPPREVRQPRWHQDDVRTILTVGLVVVVVLGVYTEMKTAVELRLIKDLHDLRDIFGEPLAALVGALTAAIGFFFADSKR